MTFDELPLHHDRPTPAVPPRRPARAASSTRWVIVGATALVAFALIYLWWMSRGQANNAVPAPALSTDVQVRQHRPPRQPMDLPSLDGSDGLVRGLVAVLSSHPGLARFLATNALVRGTVLAVEQVGDGKTPASPLAAFQPASRVAIVGTDTGRVDPRSYARWDSATGALTSVRPSEAAQLYVNLKPLFDAAYRELGHPNGDFDTAIVRAIQQLQDTPDPGVDPLLRRGRGYYEHTDAALRSLRPVQKQFLLVGPNNRTRIQQWLKAFADALDLKI